jgi:site-specific DNA-methyltransferase (adenine-specific)
MPVSSQLQVHFSSGSAEWSTPLWLYDALNAKFHFTLDPCATTENAKCQNFFTAQVDGLAQDWGHNVVFMNPPYGRVIARWMRKAFESAQQGAVAVCLVPARTDTRWWHQYAMRGHVCFLRGRLKFGGARHGAPFPSAIVIFGRLPTVKKRRALRGCSCMRHGPTSRWFCDNAPSLASRSSPRLTTGAERH